MREILFRGKRIDNNQWIEGYFFPQSYYGRNRWFIASCVQNGSIQGFEVDHNTVGQYTGLTDKNGKKIFEGDIISDGKITRQIIWDEEWAKFRGVTNNVYRDSSLCQSWLDEYEKVIIGNIHDNPDLIPII